MRIVEMDRNYFAIDWIAPPCLLANSWQLPISDIGGDKTRIWKSEWAKTRSNRWKSSLRKERDFKNLDVPPLLPTADFIRTRLRVLVVWFLLMKATFSLPHCSSLYPSSPTPLFRRPRSSTLAFLFFFFFFSLSFPDALLALHPYLDSAIWTRRKVLRDECYHRTAKCSLKRQRKNQDEQTTRHN